MKIVYWGNVKNCPRPTQDMEILKGLKKHAEVKFFDIKNFDMKKLIEEANNADLFLFHAQIPSADEVTEMLMVEKIQVVLQTITCKKVLWFMEKVWMGKMNIIDRLLPYVDHAFFTDGTWVRRVKEDVHALACAAPVKFLRGKYRPELACDIAYVGQLYGPRTREYEILKERFGDAIKFYDNKFGQDLADLCKSAKILLMPSFPFDDFYWSSRLYTYLSYGAFVIQRRTYGLREEGFVDGKHFFEYEKESDFMALIGSVLEKDAKAMRKGMARNAQKFVKQHTYEQRVKEMLDIIERRQVETKS